MKSVIASGLGLMLAIVVPPPKPVCELLSTGDVSKVVGVAVTVDPSQSGPAENGWDFCAWKMPDGHFVIVGIGAKASLTAARTDYAATLVSAFGGGPQSTAIAGLADEAQYRDYTGNLKGGVVVVRKGSAVMTIEAPTSRGDVLALARLVLARVGAAR